MPRSGWIKTVSPDWVRVIAKHRPAFVNVWQAGLGPWRRVASGDVIFLKRRGSVEDIIGFGTVYCRMAAFSSSIWNRYGSATGAENEVEFQQEVARRNPKHSVVDPVIGNIIVENLIFFSDRPFKLFQQVEELLGHHLGSPITAKHCEQLVHQLYAHAEWNLQEASTRAPKGEAEAPQDSLQLHAWEDAVRVVYRSGCGVTSKKLREVVQVVAIKPFDLGGPYHVSNGILLDLNLATLFMQGLITFHFNGALLASPELALADRELYRDLAGKVLKLPTRSEDRPDPELLQWRLTNPYRR